MNWRLLAGAVAAVCAVCGLLTAGPAAASLVTAEIQTGQNTISIGGLLTQYGTVGVSTSLQIVATDSDPLAVLTYSISEEPPGLMMDYATGLIQGTPTLAGTYFVTVRVTDGTGASAKTTFAWAINPAPAVTGMIRGYQGMCAADANYANVAGTKVVIHQCGASLLRDQWTAAANSELRIRGLCLTDPNWGRWRTDLTLEPCHGWTNQEWTHHSDGAYTVAVHHLCMTDPRWSTREGTQLIIRSCRGWTNQRWTSP